MLLDAWASHFAVLNADGKEHFEDDDFDLDAILDEAERRAEPTDSDEAWEPVDEWQSPE